MSVEPNTFHGCWNPILLLQGEYDDSNFHDPFPWKDLHISFLCRWHFSCELYRLGRHYDYWNIFVFLEDENLKIINLKLIELMVWNADFSNIESISPLMYFIYINGLYWEYYLITNVKISFKIIKNFRKMLLQFKGYVNMT